MVLKEGQEYLLLSKKEGFPGIDLLNSTVYRGVFHRQEKTDFFKVTGRAGVSNLYFSSRFSVLSEYKAIVEELFL